MTDEKGSCPFRAKTFNWLYHGFFPKRIHIKKESA